MSEERSVREHPGHVVLEIGGDLGALVVHTGRDLLGREIEISPEGHDDERSHKEVLERPVGGRLACVAVFDRLHCGEFTLWVDGVARDREVAVTGGAISEIDWTSGEG